ncbi:MAG: phosphatidylserine decarboxylase [Pseudomonadota bacterium]
MSNNHITDLAKVILVPIHKEGFKFILIFAVATIILALMSSTLGTIGLVLTLWCIFFFRDPERFTPRGENLIISPADGVINLIEQNATPPAELGLANNDWTKISVFLNVFNVHVNRAPIAGKITQVKYQEGKFFSANLEEASAENERNSAVVKTKSGAQIVFVQVAGLVARRIVSDLKEGAEVEAGERYGIIRFGSRADIYLPKTSQVKVLVGQTMVGGETVIGEL